MNSNYPKTILPMMNKGNYLNTIDDLYQNPLEKYLNQHCKAHPYALKLIDTYPVYCFGDKKYLSYRKELKQEHKVSIIQEHFNATRHKWKENAYLDMISLYSFMFVRKNYEHYSSYLFRDFHSVYCDTWGVLHNGTILSPSETRKIVQLLQVNHNNRMSSETTLDEAREVYLTSLAEENYDVL